MIQDSVVVGLKRCEIDTETASSATSTRMLRPIVEILIVRTVELPITEGCLKLRFMNEFECFHE